MRVAIDVQLADTLNVDDMNITWSDLDLPPINLLSLGKEDSSCQGKCSASNGKCSGCLRTLDEITDWVIYDPHERWQIIRRIYSE